MVDCVGLSYKLFAGFICVHEKYNISQRSDTRMLSHDCLRQLLLERSGEEEPLRILMPDFACHQVACFAPSPVDHS